MDDVLTQLNRASPTIRRLCEAQGINVESISNDFISARAGMTKWSADQIAQHNAEVRERAVANGKLGGKIGGATTGRMYSEAAAAVKKGNTTGVAKHSLDAYAKNKKGHSEASAKMAAGDRKYAKWAQSLESNNEKSADKSNKNIADSLKRLHDSGELELIRSREKMGKLYCGKKYLSQRLSTGLIGCSDRKYPDVIDGAYKLFDIDVSHIKGVRQKVEEVRNLLKRLPSEAKWLKSEA